MTDYIIESITIAIGFLLVIIIFLAAGISIYEKEKRAAVKFFWLAFGLSLPFFIAGFAGYTIVGGILSAILILTLIIILFPFSRPTVFKNMNPNSQFDERDTMFARKDLVPDSENYKDYYNRHPENKELDDHFRELPGLLNSRSHNYHPLGFASTNATFKAVANLKSLIKDRPVNQNHNITPENLTMYIKSWAKKLGAVDCGITVLQDYHLYSHKGRFQLYGKKIENNHKYGIAFTVEMDRDMISSAPGASIVMESARQYLNAGAIAVQVSEFLRLIGYPATAHIDGNYEVICPLVARDAGLGEIGRMGLLMTPKLGPRVRISVVTTDAPLITDKRKPDFSVVDFCHHCQKCASVCPAQAIPYNDMEENNGVLRWQINSESCYIFWCQVGTDCSRCMYVFPYSHPDNLMHNLVRKTLKQSTLFHRLAVKLDDYFYGSRPAPKPLPDWMRIKTSTVLK
ncbi:MAG: reductive dehalogenase domain-containing protein [Calditrichaceae bacterium]